MRMRRALWVVGLAACTALGMGVSPAQASPAGAAAGQLGVAGAAPAAVVQPAFAPITVPSDCTNHHEVISPDRGATACFKEDGEHLGICDTKADGHHPVVFYSIPSMPPGSFRRDWHGMNGTCLDINLDLPEGTEISYFACNYEGDLQLDCSTYLIEHA